jgi:predicted metalloprotease
MRWEGRRQSENVEDRRGIGGPVLVGGGLITLLLMVAMMFLGFDPQMVAQIAPEIAGPQQQAPAKPINDEMTKMVKVVLADNEDVWGRLFPKHFRGRYAPPTLVLFSGRVQSACGMASAAAGPFYCPLDKKVYIDLAF